MQGKVGHVPYRDSRLTRLLQPSLGSNSIADGQPGAGGNSRTAIICTLSPAASRLSISPTFP